MHSLFSICNYSACTVTYDMYIRISLFVRNIHAYTHYIQYANTLCVNTHLYIDMHVPHCIYH